MVSPMATTAVARRRRSRFTRSSARFTRSLRKSSSKVATSGKMSWHRKTNGTPHRRAQPSAARPRIGGSVRLMTTSGRVSRIPASDAEPK